LHFRELLMLRLAPDGSGLLSAILPEDRERMRPLSEAFSEEDLLRVLDVLTRAEGDLRFAQDPRVTLELALLKLVQMRRLMPFAELVDRVERLAGGLPAPAAPGARAPVVARAAVPAQLPAAPAQLPAATTRAAGGPTAAAAASRPAASEPLPAPATAGPAQGASAILAAMVDLSVARPSLVQPLRGAAARLDGDTLVLEVPPDFAGFAEMHVDEYRDLAKKAAGRPLKIQVGLGAAVVAPEAPPSQEQVKRQRLRKEAEREPAVQDALDLFEGKVVDVREAKPAKESV
jgi:DNA polymerase III gamma/tau subunit